MGDAVDSQGCLAYCLLHESVSFRWYSLPGQPAPARQSPARRMIQPEVVCISNARDLTKETSASEVVGFDVVDSRYPSEVGFVQPNTSDSGHCERKRRDQGPRLKK
jgi:hypothetical protein